MTNNRRFGLLLAFALCLSGVAEATTPAETFVAGNIQSGLTILNNKALPAAQRKAQFETFLLGVTDMKRIAIFTLGSYGTTASQADKDAFAAAFQDYAVAVYQSYFSRYSGQTLTVTRTTQRAPTDFIVATSLADAQGGPPLEIDFRVRTDGPKPVIVDFSVGGLWLAVAEQAEFASVLAKSNGNIPALIGHLRQVQKQY